MENTADQGFPNFLVVEPSKNFPKIVKSFIIYNPNMNNIKVDHSYDSITRLLFRILKFFGGCSTKHTLGIAVIDHIHHGVQNK